MRHGVHFTDRADAGRQLAAAVKPYRSGSGVVYALPRGGVVLGAEVARALGLPLDLLLPRKIGHPDNPEYAIAAMTESGEMIVNEQVTANLDQRWFRDAVAAEQREAQRRRCLYLGNRTPIPVAGKTAIIIDDGIATGLTMEVAIRDARRLSPARLVVAVPVAPADTVKRLSALIDNFVVLDGSEDFLSAVGSYYDKFPQVSDEEVVQLLNLFPVFGSLE